VVADWRIEWWREAKTSKTRTEWHVIVSKWVDGQQLGWLDELRQHGLIT
jgi:hypothetical protein